MVNKRETEVRKRKKTAIKAAREAGKILKAYFGRNLRIKNKGDRNLVTNVDLKAEEKIVSLIRKDYPLDSILSEENKYPICTSSRTKTSQNKKSLTNRPTGRQTSDFDFRWIIDPLDGTHNYIRGMENFGTSIALACNKQVVLGVIYLPMSDELYFAQKGRGAFLNQSKISVSRKNLKGATMIYDSTIRLNKGPMLKYLDKLVNKVFNIRMFGSTVRGLTYVAEGKADLEIEYNDKPWDFAAGLLLVEEAGGKATDLQGKRWTLDSKGYIAANRRIHTEVVRIIK